jgi:hypothetical protein
MEWERRRVEDMKGAEVGSRRQVEERREQN